MTITDQSAFSVFLRLLTENNGALISDGRRAAERESGRGAVGHESRQLSVLPSEKLPPGPWRSLGGYLDYSGWDARERFMELDAAIGRFRSEDPEGSVMSADYQQELSARRVSHACRDAA